MKGVVNWQCPDEGWVKVNSDAAFDPSVCTSSGGVVIRDHSGMVFAAAARCFDYVPDALTAEAMVAKEGLELAAEVGCDKVILEVDCSSLKNLLEGIDCSRSSIGGLCSDIIELGRGFSAFNVVWVSRDANSVAHCCAGMVLVTERSRFWLDDIPDWLRDLAANDCNPIVS